MHRMPTTCPAWFLIGRKLTEKVLLNISRA